MRDVVQLGPFSVGEQVGIGGMGSVFRGIHRETGVPVAIKVIHRATDQKALRQFHREVQAHAGLLHPGIVYLFEYGEADAAAAEASDGALAEGSPFVAMELADRGTVRSSMPIDDWETVCRLLVQILDALAYAHARGVIHRDLKPSNFLIFDRAEAGWRVKLADFGIAHAFTHERDAETDRLASAMGTVSYMAPEQLRGRWRDYGPWTDLYAIGCVAWELVCGRPPFCGETDLAIGIKHQTDERPPLEPQFPIPEAFESWVHRAMAIEPEHRFRRAADAAWALPRAILADRPAGGSRHDSRDFLPERPARTNDLTQSWTPTLTRTVLLDRGDDGSATGMEATRDARDKPAPPADRTTGRVADLLQALHPPIPEDWRPETTDPLPAPLVGAGLGLFGLREPPFVDRADEGRRIWRALHRVVEQESWEYVFVAGEPGTGKSRLAEWMTTRAHEVGAATPIRVIHTASGGPNAGLTGALDRSLRTLKMSRAEVYDHLRETLPGADDGADLERDARALTELLRPTDPDADEVEGPNYRFTDARQRRALIVRLLTRLSRRRPLVLWLDDLQWGSETIGLLEHLAESNDPPPMLVLATLRSDLVAERPALRTRLERLEATAPTTRVTLEPLAPAHHRALLDGLLPLEPDLADRLADRTEGHPLFAMQLLGHWIDGGDIEVGSDGFRVAEGRELELPEDVHHLWLDRIERLPELSPEQTTDEVGESLELAAALGREVDSDEWRSLLEEAGLPHRPRLVDRLVDRGLAERTANGWAFAHGLLVESLARRAREADRWTDHHRLCARTLAANLDGDIPGPRERIADHWVAAGEPERALAPLLAEIELYSERREDDERRRLLERRAELLDALAIDDRDPRRLVQQLEMAQVPEPDRDVRESRNRALDVWKALDDDAPRLAARSAALLARLDDRLGDLEGARTWARRALEASRRCDDDRLRSRAHRLLAWNYVADSQHQRATEHAERAVEWAEHAGHHFGRLQGLRLKAHLGQLRGDERTGQLLETIGREAGEAGFARIEAQAASGLGDWTRFDGRLDEAREHYRRFRNQMDALLRPAKRALADLKLAQVELGTGDFEAALDHLDSACETLAAIGAPESEPSLVHLIRLALAAGRRERDRWSDLWSHLSQGWPEGWRLEPDHPWLLATAADYAREAGWEEAASDARSLAEDLRAHLECDGA